MHSPHATLGGKKVDLREGINDQQAKELLRQDIEVAKKGLRKNIKDFDTLPQKYQDVLVNIAFNVGVNKATEAEWPSMLKGMRADDDQVVRNEMVTTYMDDKTKQKVRLVDRAKDIADAVGLDP
jgi:GH24 family phage-related lysozyme (muramidase)